MAGKFGAFLKGIIGPDYNEPLGEVEEEEEEDAYSAQAWLEYLGLDGIADTPNESTCSMDELRAIMMIKRAEPLPESLEQKMLDTRDARVAKYGTKAQPVAYVDNSTSYAESSRSSATNNRNYSNDYTDDDTDGNSSYEEDERITMTRARHHRR